MDAGPLTKDEFSRLMADCGLTPDGGPVAVAVSGGADSLALSLLVADWGDAVFLTFDHGLRPESADEAVKTGSWLKQRNLQHHILTWDEPGPKGNLQAAARDARYAALENRCARNGIRYLLLAHHLDDQAETFLLRLARGSGADGLAAMDRVSHPLTRKDGPAIIRPLLNIPKARLVVTLKDAGQDWIEDPSNEDRGFDRIKTRDFLKNPSLPGLNTVRLAATAKRMRRVRDSLEIMTAEMLKTHVTIHPEGYGTLNPHGIADYGEEIGLRVLARVLMHIGGQHYPPRLASLERLYETIIHGDLPGSALAGCLVQGGGQNGNILVMRELAAVDGAVAIRTGERCQWDDRFLLLVQEGASGESFTAKALGQDGWNFLLSKAPDVATAAKNIPWPVKLTLPAFRAGNALVAVPHLHYQGKKWQNFNFKVCFDPLVSLYPARMNANK